jgi:hypothetical protein
MQDETQTGHRRLGRLPMKTTRKALLFADFFKYVTLPASCTYWRTKAPIPTRTYGNTEHGCCTIAKQAVAITRMERQEQRRLVAIEDAEVLRVYYAMSDALYGGGDNGAYEDDALNRWRNPDLTVRDTAGNPYTIDAYLRINAANHRELRAGLALSGPKGIAVCLNLPAVFQRMAPPDPWDVSEVQPLVGEWQPGSWGGHSMWAHGYTAQGIWLDHTWGIDPQLLTWRAAAAYLDEAHLVIDSLDTWRKRATASSGRVKFSVAAVRDAVNDVSSIQV